MPYVGRFNSIRKDTKRSPSHHYSRSPATKNRKAHSPYRRRGSRSPRRKSRSPVRRKSRSPVRRKSRSPVRRKSRSPVHRKSRSPNVGRRSRTPPAREKSRSPHSRKKQRSPQVRKKSRSPARLKSRSPVGKSQSSPKHHHSPPPKTEARKKPRSSSGPKVFMDTSNIDQLEQLINRKKTLNERFKSVVDAAFEIEENITIGIQRNPYAPASSSVTVTQVFDPALFTMVHHHQGSGRQRLLFDRPELKEFRFDEMPHDDSVEYEKRTITVAPPRTVPSASTSKRKSLHISRSPSPRKPTQVKVEMRRDPKYEKFFEESLRADDNYKTNKQTKTINANDLRHNISRRHEDNPRFSLEPLSSTRNRDRSRSRSRSRSRNRLASHSDSHSETDSSGYHRQLDKPKTPKWRDNPSYTPKGISYYQSLGKAGLLDSLKGYVSDVSEKQVRYKNGVALFTFNFYTEKEFVKGISFFPNFWSTLKTVDGSTCLGVMFDRVKLRPPKSWSQWSLVLDKFSSLEAMLMPFDLSEDVRKLGKDSLVEERKFSRSENQKDMEKKLQNKSLDDSSSDEDKKHDTRESSGQDRRHFGPRSFYPSGSSTADPRDSRPPPTRGRGGFVRRGGYGQGSGRFNRGGFVRGRGGFRGRNIIRGSDSFQPNWRSHRGEHMKKFGESGRKEGVSTGKWKHDMFDQQDEEDKDIETSTTT